MHLALIYFFFFQKPAAVKMVSYEKQRSKTFYTSNRREEDKICFEKAVDAINMAKEVRCQKMKFKVILITSKM